MARHCLPSLPQMGGHLKWLLERQAAAAAQLRPQQRLEPLLLTLRMLNLCGATRGSEPQLALQARLLYLRTHNS